MATEWNWNNQKVTLTTTSANLPESKWVQKVYGTDEIAEMVWIEQSKTRRAYAEKLAAEKKVEQITQRMHALIEEIVELRDEIDHMRARLVDQLVASE